MNGITIEKNKDITGFTTFGIPVKARYFAEYSSEKELLKISRTDEFIGNEVLHICSSVMISTASSCIPG